MATYDHTSNQGAPESSNAYRILNHCLNRFYEKRVSLNRHKTDRNNRKHGNGDEIGVNRPPTIGILVYHLVCGILKSVHILDERFTKEPICMGSYYQGLKIGKTDEFDYCVKLNFGRNLHCSGSDQMERECTKGVVTNGNTHGICKFLHDIKVGTTRLSLTSTETKEYQAVKEDLGSEDRCVEAGSNTFEIVPFLVRRRLSKLIKLGIGKLNLKDFGVENILVEDNTSGPATELKVKFVDAVYNISIDITPIIEIDLSFTSWPRSGTLWPSPSKIESMEKRGLDVVPKKNSVWSIDAVKYENELLKNIDEDKGSRKRCQNILKYLKEYWSSTDLHFFRSYCLKNALYWECEYYPNSDQWPKGEPAIRVLSMTRRLCGWLQQKFAPWYFWPEVDILELTEQDEQHRTRIVQHMESFLEDPIRTLLLYD